MRIIPASLFPSSLFLVNTQRRRNVFGAAVKISIKQTRGLTARTVVIYAKRFDTNGNESIQRYGKSLFVIAILRYFTIRLVGQRTRTASCDKDTLFYVLQPLPRVDLRHYVPC